MSNERSKTFQVNDLSTQSPASLQEESVRPKWKLHAEMGDDLRFLRAMLIVMVFLFILILLGYYTYVHGSTGKANGRVPGIFMPPSNSISSVYYYKSYRTKVYECNVTESDAIKFGKEMECDIKPINRRPIKMVRYNFCMNKDKFQRERTELTPETENGNSCFHFLKNGYYSIGHGMHWAYDTDNQKMVSVHGH